MTIEDEGKSGVNQNMQTSHHAFYDLIPVIVTDDNKPIA